MITAEMLNQSYEHRTVSWCFVWATIRRTEAKRKGDEHSRKLFRYQHSIQRTAVKLRRLRK